MKKRRIDRTDNCVGYLSMISENNQKDKTDTRFQRPGRSDLVILLVVLLVSVAFAVAYVSSERYYYWSDLNYYQFFASFSKSQLLEAPLQFPFILLASTGFVYNMLYTIPLLPVTLLLGDSRVVFIAASTAIFQTPYLLVMAGLVAKSRAPGSLVSRKLALWTVPLLAMLVPTVWAPTLRGYPDYFGSIFILTAALGYLGDMELKRRSSVTGIGILLAIGPIIRRHFFYQSFAVAAAMLVSRICRISKSRAGSSEPSDSFAKWIVRWIAVGAVSVGCLVTIGFFFVSAIVKSNYLDLYESAYVSPFEGAGYLITSYGVLAWVLALWGFLAAIRSKEFVRDHVLFLLVFSSLSALFWPLFGRHIACHYTINSTPFIVIGTSLLLLESIAQLQKRARSEHEPDLEQTQGRESAIKKRELAQVAIFLTGTVLLVNLAIGFLPSSWSSLLPFSQARFRMLTVPEKEADMLGTAFSANWSPLERNDFEQLDALTDYLMRISRGKKSPGKKKQKGFPIFIIAGSEILCPDIIRNSARRGGKGFDFNPLDLFEPSILDSRDALPIGAMLQARYLVVATPVTTIYPPESEKVLETAVNVVQNHWAISRDFLKLPREFRLDKNTRVSIYKRLYHTDAAVAASTVEKMVSLIGRLPGGQPDWISTDERFEPAEAQNRTNYKLGLDNDATGAHYLLSSTKFEPSETCLLAVSSNDSRPLSLDIEWISPEGVRLSENTIQVTPEKNVSVTNSLEVPAYCALYLRSSSIGSVSKEDQFVEISFASKRGNNKE